MTTLMFGGYVSLACFMFCSGMAIRDWFKSRRTANMQRSAGKP